MYCTNCGSLIAENAKLCVSCGTVIAGDAMEKDGILDEETSSNNEFIFKRHKSLGKLDISYTISNVNICNKKLNITQQKVTLYWFKKQPIQTSHDISSFTNIKVKKTIDKSDMIFAIIFILIGFVDFMGFLMGGLLLWIGLGYKVRIGKINGAEIEIPAEFSKDCLELVNRIVEVNRSIVVEQ